jgi:prepilin-type N-terminal cleavage/methylation domain-containing protein
MKTKIKNQKSSSRAFTLVELITVIAIVVILVGMTVGILGSAQKKAGIEHTKGQLALIQNWLEQYKEAYGEYPPSETSNGRDSEGAKVLYQALTGDGNNLIGGDEGSNGKLEDSELKANKSWIDPSHDSNGLVAKDKKKEYVLKDAFGNAWQYMSYVKGDNQLHNSTYDLWSYGSDQDKREESRWIKNW